MKIHYSHHPHYGEVVTLVRKCASFGLHQAQVALPSGDQLLVPEWMLDEELCRGMEVVERSRIPTRGAVVLGRIDRCAEAASRLGDTVASEASSSGGAFRESTTPGCFSLGGSPETGVFTSHSTALTGVTEPHASGGGEHSGQPGGGGER
jgi:hypothetical protein